MIAASGMTAHVAADATGGRYARLQAFGLDFQKVSSCPVCNAPGEKRTRIPIVAYRFGSFQIKLPEGGVNLVECLRCGLHYKDLIPTPESLGKLFAAGAQAVWTDRRIAFTLERQHLAAYLAEGDGSFVDIGSSDGALLRAMASVSTVRSAIDVYDDPRCRASVTGEYLIGFIEDVELPVTRSYNAATLFDVFEHFYSPTAVASNLRRLLNEAGVVFGETGDSGAVVSPADWWYVRLVEHHIFWNRKALEYFCHLHGFRLERLESLAHKGRRYMPAWKRWIAWFLHITRQTPVADLLWRVRRIDASMIGNPYQRDHVLFALRKS